MRKILFLLFIFICINMSCMSKEIVNYENGIYHIIIPHSDIDRIKFILSDKLVTNKFIHKKYNSLITINTGFFDPVSGKTISYIYTDGFLAENPLNNENILNSEFIMQNWDKISNRAEFRIIKENSKYIPVITYHNNTENNIITSAQGGPMLLPDFDMEKECFIVKNDNTVIRESASVLHKTARTVIAIKDNDIHILIITNKHPMTINEVKELCIKYNFNSAMAFDGGSSTSFDYKNKYHVVSTGIKGDDTGRKLKSFMVYK